MATYDHEITLIKQEFIEDENGNPRGNVKETPKTVLGNVKSVGRTEYYNASAAGIRPSIIFVIHGYEYEGEQIVEFEGERYRVIRSFATGFEEIELTCEG